MVEKSDGPLAGLRVVEFAGLGPAPMAGMLLADLGATVIRVDKTNQPNEIIDERYDFLLRNKFTISLDLKDADDREKCIALLNSSDVLIEGFRPGVMERLGLGPDDVLASNSRIVYARVTGWGQTGPLAQEPGHDINFVALSGALAAIGRKGELPAIPLALIGDFGGGALYLAFGILCACREVERTGRGQVVDAAMLDGAISMMTAFYGMFAGGEYSLERGTNLLDSGSPFYDVYRCACGGLISIGAIEERFRSNLFDILELETVPSESADLRSAIQNAFLRKTRSDWESLMRGAEVCFAPVLTMAEAPTYEHNRARQAFISIDGVDQPAVAPRFSETPARMPRPNQRGRYDEALRMLQTIG